MADSKPPWRKSSEKGGAWQRQTDFAHQRSTQRAPLGLTSDNGEEWGGSSLWSQLAVAAKSLKSCRSTSRAKHSQAQSALHSPGTTEGGLGHGPVGPCAAVTLSPHLPVRAKSEGRPQRASGKQAQGPAAMRLFLFRSGALPQRCCTSGAGADSAPSVAINGSTGSPCPSH